jgi:hypothetical protein
VKFKNIQKNASEVENLLQKNTKNSMGYFSKKSPKITKKTFIHLHALGERGGYARTNTKAYRNFILRTQGAP